MSGARQSRRIGPYEVSRRIGHGGMAVVYLAEQPALGRRVALKELAQFHAGDSGLARRFLQEAQVAGALNHPNIVTVYDFLEQDGIPYIAMEYVEHGSLRPLVGHLTLAQIAGVLEGLLAGLASAETMGVAHRDLKPENLLISDSGGIKIADFGIAKAYNQVATGDVQTATGMTLGTPSYMAPEQAMAQEIGPWTDLYQSGIVAYELLAGQVPFRSDDSPLAVLMQHVNEPLPPLGDEVDPALAAWVDRMAAKAPGERPRSARAAWHELEEVVVDLLGPLWRREARLGEPDPTVEHQAPLTPAPFAAGDTPAGEAPDAPPGETAVGDYVTFEEPVAERPPEGPPIERAPAPAPEPPPAPPTPAVAPDVVALSPDSPHEVQRRAAHEAPTVPPTRPPEPPESPSAPEPEPQPPPAPEPAAAHSPAPPPAPPSTPPEPDVVAVSPDSPAKVQRRAERPRERPGPRPRGGRWALAVVGAVAAVIAFVLLTGGDDQQSAEPTASATATAEPTAAPVAAGPFDVGEGPDGIAVGEGAVWVAVSAEGKLARIDPDSGKVTTIDVGDDPDSVVTGFGSVWVSITGESKVVRVEPGEQPEVIGSFDVGARPEGLAISGRAVWSANAGDGSVTQINAETGETSTVTGVGDGPVGLAIGAGAVWVANSKDGTLGRVDGGKRALAATVTGIGPDPRAVAIVERNVWVLTAGDGRVWRVDADANQVTGSVKVGRNPRSIATDGTRLWVTENAGARVAEIDPATMRVLQRSKVATGPIGVAVSPDSIWVTAFSADRVSRVPR